MRMAFPPDIDRAKRVQSPCASPPIGRRLQAIPPRMGAAADAAEGFQQPALAKLSFAPRLGVTSRPLNLATLRSGLRMCRETLKAQAGGRPTLPREGGCQHQCQGS
jgi:hypothetical protein